MRVAIALIVTFCLVAGCASRSDEKGLQETPSVTTTEPRAALKTIALPAPRYSGPVSLEEALKSRRSRREFADRELSLEQISQLLWACQGITDPSFGKRTAPSAGALYPLEVYLVSRKGVFHYRPNGHELVQVREGDVRHQLSVAALNQRPVAKAPVSIVITAVVARTAEKYGGRAERYVHLEAGHACQNVLLQAVTLGLGAVPIGAFVDQGVQKILSLPHDHEPIYIIPVGYPDMTGM
jgi:SagB-type dehydrogenase family enzyme